jgi:hypothetical protein
VVPVVVFPSHQAKRAHALYEHCLRLDGTSIHLIEQTQEDDVKCEIRYPKNRFHCLQGYSLRRAAREIGAEFIWLECDSIPLRPGWVRRLMDEYWKCERKFLLSSDHQPHDLVGGIGCYPEDTADIVPVHFEKSGWDLWLIEEVPHLVARTPSIQHSYCHYGLNGFCKCEHRFPRDQKMLRSDALIFHRDPHQDLITV